MKKYIATIGTSNIQRMKDFPLRSYDTMERTGMNGEEDMATFTFTIAGNGLSVPQQRYLDKLKTQEVPFTWEEKEEKDYQKQYYENIVLPKRKAEYAARTTPVRLGKPQKYGPDAIEIHVKFDGELAQFIEDRASDIGYQAFFEMLVENEYQQVTRSRENAEAG